MTHLKKKKRQPKVLIAAPTSRVKDYVFLDWLLNVKSFTYKNVDILLCDNSVDIKYQQYLNMLGVKTLRVNPEGKNPREYVTESQNLLRSYFLNNDYDYYFSLESDILPPKDVIEKLLMADLDVVSGLYFYNFGAKSNLLLNYFVKEGDKKYRTHNPTLKEALQWVDGSVKQVYECGIGCTLIKRAVLEKIPFRWVLNNNGFSDTHFYADLYKNGYLAFVDTSILCKHKNSSWSNNIDHILSTDLKL